MKSGRIGSLVRFLVAFTCLGILVSTAFGASAKRVVSVQGITDIGSEIVVVEVLVLVDRDEKDPQGKAKAAMKRLYPEVTPAAYALSGFVWDVFLDADPSNDRVVVNYNPGEVPSNIAGEDHLGVLLSGMAKWTEVPTSSFVFEFGEVTGRDPSLVKESKGPQRFDGNNDVAWVNIRERNVLGVTWYGTSTDEFDVAIDNEDYTWYIGDPSLIGPGKIDLQSVETHEFGHAVGLGHSAVPGAIMEPYYEAPRRDLSPDDIDGISALYPVEGADIPPTVSITSPADGAMFDVGTLVTFTGTAADEDEDLAGSIAWSSDLDGSLGVGASVSAALSLGTHTVTASATDSEGKSGSDAITVTMRDPTTGAAAIVESVTYDTSGGRHKNRDLLTTVKVVDDTPRPVPGAAVSILLRLEGGGSWTGSGSTGDDGRVTFKLRRAPAGTYTTEVTEVTASGLVWDRVTPPNSFQK